MAIQITDSLDQLAHDWSLLPYERASDKFILGDIQLSADILLVGEAPGQDEDEQGRPFVGRAGQRLDDTLARVGLDRANVSVTNVFPRRPDKNREPTHAEILAQRPFVDRLVALHPNLKAVGLLGGKALEWKFGQEKIESYRGEQRMEGGVWYVPMLHPAAVLYQQSNLKWLVQDLRRLKVLSEGNYLDVSDKSFEFITTAKGVAILSEKIMASPILYVDVEAAAPAGISALAWWDPRVSPILLSLGWWEGKTARSAVVEVNEDTSPALRILLDAAVEAEDTKP